MTAAIPNLITVVDYASFAAGPGGGNPAAVVVDAKGRSDAELQTIATRSAATTTGFVVGRHGDGPFAVRFFTPKQEITLCGHVTIAVFSELVHLGILQAPAYAHQTTAAGPLSVWVGPTSSGPEVEMTQKVPRFLGTLDPARIGPLFGQPPDPSLPISIVSTGLRHLVVPFSSTAALGHLAPDIGGLVELSRQLGVDTIAAFSRTRSGVRLRDFCPGIGDDEEAASGTTAGALACYLFANGPLEVQGETATLNVEQGIEMGRPSRLRAQLTLRCNEIVRVAVTGTATRLAERELAYA